MIDLNLECINIELSKDIIKDVKEIHKSLHDKTSEGNDFLGWLNYPLEFDIAEFKRVKEVAKKIREKVNIFVVCGIGGSYLGSRAAIEMLKGLKSKDKMEIIYMGNTFSSTATVQLLDYLEDKDFAVNVISKSGTTTETAIAFRLLKKLLEKKYGEKAKEYIIATTDKSKGALRALAIKEGYQTFVIPDDIGGRYSVLTSVGLLPIAVAGLDIEQIMYGAEDAAKKYNDSNLKSNVCYQYATYRHLLGQKYPVEVFVTYETHFAMIAEWWKQLFGESEGKDGKGIFPASMNFSTDLHSLGQFVQDGNKILFETILKVKKPQYDLTLELESENFDGLNYLAGKTLSEINEQALLGTLEAHSVEGKVPNLILLIDQINEYSFGYLVYFFMKACAISSYLAKVNPFNQPGVEIYKKNMFKLLGKE